jgi:ABC-type nitrate/sulfonate/bicarbonate transport system substrate-binding protein
MIESFPIAFAHDQGIFEAHGLTVELFGIANRRDRNLALFTGSVDGALTDITSVLQLLAAEATLKITSTAYELVEASATPNGGASEGEGENGAERGPHRYTLLTHHFSGIRDLDTLLGRLDGSRSRRIGLLRETDMEYQTDLLLESRNLTVDGETHYSDFEDLVLLATLLGQGSILAAVLPEPLGSYLEYITEAEGTPVVPLSFFEGQELVPSIWAFQEALIEEKPGLLESFYAGVHEVVEQLKNTPREEVIEVGLDAALAFFFPGLTREDLPPGAEEFLQEYLIPDFPFPRGLAPEEYQGVADWAVKKGYIAESIPFELAYTNRYYPPPKA